MTRPLPPAKVIEPGASIEAVTEALAAEVARLLGHHYTDIVEARPEHAQFLYDQSATYVTALINLGVFKRA